MKFITEKDIFLVYFVIHVSLLLVYGQYEKCSSLSCKPPHCVCPSRRGPLELSVQETPQIVTFTFDDAVNADNFKIYRRFFRKTRKNPNGCPIQATFFVSHDWTSYDHVKDLYLDGHEIASHSITHRLPRNWWAGASYDDWVEEMDGQRSHISKRANVPKSAIKGLRVPFLEIGGDTQFEMMRDYGFLYDASFLAGPYSEGDWRTSVWPYTLDYPPNLEFCDSTRCPKSNFSGIWEIPLNRWIGLDSRACPMVDACTTQNLNTKQDVLKYLWKNFNRHHTNGRAFLGVNMHATWFKKEHHMDAMDDFIDALSRRDDTYLITMSQLIDWMKTPTPLDQLQDFASWKTSCKKGRMLVGRPKPKGSGRRPVLKKKNVKDEDDDYDEDKDEPENKVDDKQNKNLKTIRKRIQKSKEDREDYDDIKEDRRREHNRKSSNKNNPNTMVNIKGHEDSNSRAEDRPHRVTPTPKMVEETQVEKQPATRNDVTRSRNKNRHYRNSFRSGGSTSVAMANVVTVTIVTILATLTSIGKQ